MSHGDGFVTKRPGFRKERLASAVCSDEECSHTPSSWVTVKLYVALRQMP